MKQRKASRPAPIKHDFTTSGFYGELCPICEKQKLGVTLILPVCMRCRTKYKLTEDLLKEMQAHRLIIAQEVINWKHEPYPKLTGTINDIDWQANFVLGKWSIQFLKPTEKQAELTRLIREYLDAITPSFVDRLKRRKQKIRRRYIFFLAAGVTLVTARHLTTRHKKKIQEETQQAEDES